MGTRFLVSKESLAPAAYKQMIVDHGVDDLIVSAAITGARASWLKPSLQACGIDTDALSEERTARDYGRSEEHTSELQSLMRISYAVFCLNKKTYSTHDAIIERNRHH